MTIADRAVPEPNTGCLLWTRGRNPNGYGVVYRQGRLQKAHRVAWQEVNGDIPAGMSVCHKCDTPSCINVNHLFLGTHAENMRDMVRKGRSRSGEGARRSAAECPARFRSRSKLTVEQVREIRCAVGTRREVASRFGVSVGTVSMIANGLIWKDAA